MQHTKNLLLELYNTTTDKSVPVITWRSSVNGEVNSAFVKIDDAFGELKEQMTKISGSAIKVEAIGDGLGNFVATGINKIESYKKDDVIALIPNENCVGNSMIDINGLGNKALMKVDNSGALVILEKGDLKAKHEYYFRYDGSVFVWQIGTSAEQLNYLATNSTLKATNVKDAIDELDAKSEFLCQILGYLSPNTFTDIDELTLNGKYIGNGKGLPTTDDFWVIDVTAGNYTVTENNGTRVEKYARQTAYKVMDSNGKKTEIAVFTRNRAYDGTWSNWSEFVLDDGTADCIPDITIQGRTLVNLLGRAGNAIYQQDWTFSSVVAIYTNDTFVFSGDGSISKDINTVSGNSYLVGYIRNGAYENNIIVASATTTTVSISVSDGDVLSYIRAYQIESTETLENCTNEKYPYVDDVKCVVNPYFECDNSRIMFETKLYEGETITRQNNGTYVKNSEWEEIEIGKLELSYVNNKVGYKVILCKGLPNNFGGYPNTPVLEGINLVAFNGEILLQKDYLNTTTGTTYSTNRPNGGMWINLPNTLTGWGDNYTPTQEEIKAFFLGWTMYGVGDTNPNHIYNDGGKGWVKLWCGVGKIASIHNVYAIDESYTNTCPTTMNDDGYTPYRLIYKKETPTVEEVKTYGGLVIKDGVDVTSSSGLVLDEKIEMFKNPYHTRGGKDRIKSEFYRVQEFLNGQTENGETVSFTSNIYDANNQIKVGLPAFVPINHDDMQDYLYIDYLIYKPDTVSSYDYTLTYDNSIKSILNKTQNELITTKEELANTKKELEHTKYKLSQRSNPNLLINGDFQVWQRGISFSGTGIKYTADRWRCGTDGEMDVKKQPYGVSITNTKVGMWHNFDQFIEVPNSLKGKTVTLSVKFHTPSNMNQFYIGYRKNGAPDKTLYAEANLKNITYYKKTFTVPETDCDILWVGMQLKEELWETIKLEWVKLELGEYATPFVPRNYGEELLDCKRYYEVILPYESNGTSIDDSQSNILIKWDVEKRIIPTVSIIPDNGNVILNHYGKRIFTTSQINATYTIINNEIYLGLLSGFSGLTIGTTYYLENEVIVDAEIY